MEKQEKINQIFNSLETDRDFGMFSETGNREVQKMIKEVYHLTLVKHQGRKPILDYIKEQSRKIGIIHEEIYDTDVQERVSWWVEKIFKLAGYEYDYWTDLG